MNFENKSDSYHKWQTLSKQWNKIKHLAREMRKEPTVAENILWQELRAHKLDKLKFRRQHSINKFIVDFYCREIKLIIEVDGEIHTFQKENDLIRQEFLGELGYKVLRFKNEEVINSIEKVLEKIRSFKNIFTTSPQPPPQAGGVIFKSFLLRLRRGIKGEVVKSINNYY